MEKEKAILEVLSPFLEAGVTLRVALFSTNTLRRDFETELEKLGFSETEYLELKRAEGKAKILLKQMELALSGKGHVNMLTYLGEVVCGQKPENEGEKPKKAVQLTINYGKNGNGK